MAAKRRVIFHIGLEKTGTDSFQRFCTEQRALLLRFSTLYPTEGLAFLERNHAPLVACYLPYEDFTVPLSGQRPEVLRSLKAEIERSNASAVLISAEHFSSRFRDAEIGQLATDFSEFDCRVAVVVRGHRARLYSAYDQSVRAGRSTTLSAYCDEVFHPDNWYMRYATTIGAWERAFGHDNISVFCHSPGHDIIPVLCRALISSEFSPPADKTYWDNLSIGPGGTERLRRVNNAIARVTGTFNPIVGPVLQAPRRGLAEVIRRLNKESRDWQLSERDLRRLDEIIETDQAWLEEHYGIRLGAGDQQA
jgi:hypothetical protein